MDPELTCRELVELVTDYYEGALSAGEREPFEAHMAACEGCSVYVEQIRTTIELTGHTRALEQRPEITALLTMFRDYRRTV